MWGVVLRNCRIAHLMVFLFDVIVGPGSTVNAIKGLLRSKAA